MPLRDRTLGKIKMEADDKLTREACRKILHLFSPLLIRTGGESMVALGAKPPEADDISTFETPNLPLILTSFSHFWCFRGTEPVGELKGKLTTYIDT